MSHFYYFSDTLDLFVSRLGAPITSLLSGAFASKASLFANQILRGFSHVFGHDIPCTRVVA